ncbi:MAG: hypothetical protein R8M45_07470 [Ghiorsea sp.]
MALQTTDANGKDRYHKVMKVVVNNVEKDTRIILATGDVPAKSDAFSPTLRTRIMSRPTPAKDPIVSAYAYLKTLPEYTNAKNV